MTTPEHPDPPAVAPILLTRRALAAALGCSESAVARVSWLPDPVMLGQRSPRWIRTEVEEATTRLPNALRKIKAHGGTMTLESQEGCGMTVIIRLLAEVEGDST